jgi:hypothetical protein
MEDRYMQEYFIPSMTFDYRRNIPGELPVIDIISGKIPGEPPILKKSGKYRLRSSLTEAAIVLHAPATGRRR